MDAGTPESAPSSAAPTVTNAPSNQSAAAITREEAAVAALLFPLIPSPRSVRRFVACYQQLTHAEHTASDDSLGRQEARTGEHAAVMLLLAVRIGAPEVTEILFPALARTAAMRTDCVGLLRRCASLAPQMASLGMVQSILAPLLAEMPDRLPDAAFETWLPRVARYSFGTDRSTRTTGQSGGRSGRAPFRAASAA